MAQKANKERSEKAVIPPGSTIGILGAGQLGKMLAEAAATLGFKTHVFAPDADPIAAGVSTHFTQAEYTDLPALQKFAGSVDVITLEFENVPVAPLKTLSTPIHPSPAVLEISQHRLREKTLAQSMGINTAPFRAVTNEEEFNAAVAAIGTPGILKTSTMGYDGKGQWKITTPRESGDPLPPIPAQGGELQTYIYEGFVHFTKEISVIVARSTTGDMQCFEPVENVHRNHILHTTATPADISATVAEKALSIATRLATALDVVGLLAVEMFVTKNGDVLVNEMAPRPHNSGHWTLDGCNVSQFEQAVRAVTGMQLIKPQRTAARVVMTNLIGDDINHLEKWKGAKIHIYGKKETRPGRKMGHVTTLNA